MDTVRPSGRVLLRNVEDWLCLYPGCGRDCAKRAACFAFHAAATRREAEAAANAPVPLPWWRRFWRALLTGWGQ